MTKGKSSSTPSAVIFATVLLICILIFVTANTLVLSKSIGTLEERTEQATLDAYEFDELYGDFLGIRTYLSITVNHDDIACVEQEFAEIRGALGIGDTESAAIAKSRLLSALGHLKRLSGFNIDSII